MMENICRVEHLGIIPYKAAWTYQDKLAEMIAKGRLDQTLLLLEHPHTYTLGRSGRPENLIWSETEMKKKGVIFIKVDRGGDITYHGPGQLVGYPLLRLAPIGWHGDRLPQVDYVGYIRQLEQVLICTLSRFEIDGFRVNGKTGVWVGAEASPRKIASIGVKVDVRGISQHGFALNVDPQMDYWMGIVPCGLSDVTMTSMSEIIKERVSISQVIKEIKTCFAEVFQCKLLDAESAVEEI